MTNHLWQSTLFAAAVALLAFALKKNRAQVRYWLWLTASLKFLIPFSLLMTLGNQSPRVVNTTPAAVIAFEQFTQPFAETPVVVSQTDWTPWLLGLWVCGVLALAAIRLRDWLRIRAALRASSLLAIPVNVEVRSTPGLHEPGIVGLFHPVLLLPQGIEQRLTPEQLQTVLSHELCHIRRRDNLFASIHMVVEAIFWFHPLVWWIGSRLVDERERACDEEVLRLGGRPDVYAEAIVNVCKHYVESPLVCVSGVTGSDLKKRIEGIMKNRTLRNLNLTQKSALAIAAIAALAGPVLLGLLHAPPARAQQGKPDGKASMIKDGMTMKAPPLPPGKNAVAFEVATIKPHTSEHGLGAFAGRPRGLSLSGYSPRMLLRMAFGNIADNRIEGGPGWMNSERYAIEGQFAEGERAGPPDMYQPALRALLADRFKFKFHYEQKQFDVYDLVVAKNGHKLTPNTDGLGPGGTSNAGKFTGHKLSMATFVNRFPGG